MDDLQYHPKSLMGGGNTRVRNKSHLAPIKLNTPGDHPDHSQQTTADDDATPILFVSMARRAHKPELNVREGHARFQGHLGARYHQNGS